MSYPPGATFGPRLLPNFELVWIIAGDSVAYRDGRAIPAPAGTVLLQPRGTRDAYDWAVDRSTLHAFIHFDLGRPGRGWPPLDQWPERRDTSPNSILLALFRFILGLHGASETRTGPVLRPALELLLRTFVSGQSEVASELRAPLPDVVSRVLRFVSNRLQKDPAERLRLPDLAGHARVSPQHLCRVFERSLGHGPMECVRLVRIEQAATELERTDDRLHRIAERCGFASPYHFSRVFRAVYGDPPSIYRQKFQLGVKQGIPRARLPAMFGDSALWWLTIR